MAANAVRPGFPGRVANYWHMLPEANQARKALWDAVNPATGKRRIDEAFPQELRETTRDNEMLIRFKSGSTYQVVGSDNYESLIGSPPVGIVFSEWSKAKPQAWAYLSPILAENKGWALFIYTPRGRNHGQKLLDTARRSPNWYGEILTVEDTGVLPREILEEQLQELIGLYGPDAGRALWLQEFYCDFNAPILGALFGTELAQVDKQGRITRVPHNPEYPVFTAWDLGYSDDTAIWWYQVIAGEIRLLEYYEAHGKAPEHYASQILGRTVQIDIVGDELALSVGAPIPDLGHRQEYRYGMHHLPHDARARTLAAKGKSLIEQLGKALDISKMCIAPELSVQDGIQAARLMFRRCYFDLDGTQEGIDALRNYQREWDDKKREFKDTPKHDWTSHGADAFRILAVVWSSSAKLDEKPVSPPIRMLMVGPNTHGPTLEDLWAESGRRSVGRI